MSQNALELLESAATVTAATVTATSAGGVSVRSAELGERLARVAVVGAWIPERGDQVLVIDDGRGQTYVVGVLRALRDATEQDTLLGTLRVESADGVTRLVAAEGDLELSAPRGRVRLSASEDITLESERDVRARAEGAIVLESHDGERTRSGLRLEGDAAKLEAGVFVARAARLVVIAEDLHGIAARLDARVDDVRQHARRIETHAVELIEHLEESYREVEGLAQTRAGTIRLVAAGALSALAERAKLKAKSVFAIDGESIHLG